MPGVNGKRPGPSRVGGPLTDLSICPRATGVLLNVTISWGSDKEERLQAFVDSGAAGNFIDAGLAKALGLPLVPLDKPRPVSAIDGRPLEPGEVSQQTKLLCLRIGQHCEKVSFYLISAPSVQLVLGFPWLQRHNPCLDWLNRSIRSWGPLCQNSCLQNPRPSGTALALSPSPETPDLSRVPPEY